MSSPEGSFSKARVEAFSDGVLAVIITIMVLELKAPHSQEPDALVQLWPSFAIYFVSFFLIALIWVNHHSLLVQARRITTGLLWANIGVLLWTSLIPFATAYVAETRLAPFPTAVYAALQCVCGLSFNVMFRTIAAQRDDEAFRKGAKTRRRQNHLAVAMYALAAIVAFLSPIAATLLIVAIALAYLAPTFLDAKGG